MNYVCYVYELLWGGPRSIAYHFMATSRESSVGVDSGYQRRFNHAVVKCDSDGRRYKCGNQKADLIAAARVSMDLGTYVEPIIRPLIEEY